MSEVGSLPSGTLTFLFTDIEGSTRPRCCGLAAAAGDGVFFDQMDQLDGWLRASLDADVLAARLAEGRALEPGALRAVARRAIDRHLDG